MSRRFSQRNGLSSPRAILQIDGLDEGTRNRLWTVIINWFRIEGPTWESEPRAKAFFVAIWDKHFKLPTDDIRGSPTLAMKSLRTRYFEMKWWEIYDFFEFMAAAHVDAPDLDEWQSALVYETNSVLAAELCGFRLVGGFVVPVTSPVEVAEVEKALELPNGEVSRHIEQAIEFLSDKQEIDFRNCVKEAVSAVEAAARVVSGDAKATLGKAIYTLKAKHGLHPALEKSLTSLYGYTSDASGIRHALTEDGKAVDRDLAKFMLVTCSAFANYLISHQASVTGARW